jgi:TPP-dependent 2-oxoacid decarboxylase
MSKALSKSQAYLDDVTTAPGEIDRVLRDAYLSARPVYLMLPTDMVLKEVPGQRPCKINRSRPFEDGYKSYVAEE